MNNVFTILISILLIIALNACSSIQNHSASLEKTASAVEKTQTEQVNQEEKLLAQLEKTGVEINREKYTVTLTLPEETNFTTGSLTPNDDIKQKLTTIAAVLKADPYLIAEIAGNRDNVGPKNVNQALSEKRAHAIIAQLESLGIPGNRLIPVGFIEKPATISNPDEEVQTTSPHVEITLH